MKAIDVIKNNINLFTTWKVKSNNLMMLETHLFLILCIMTIVDAIMDAKIINSPKTYPLVSLVPKKKTSMKRVTTIERYPIMLNLLGLSYLNALVLEITDIP